MADGLGTAPAKVELTENRKLHPLDDDDVLDWDFALEIPPTAQRSGRIEVTLRKVNTSPSPD